MDTQDLINRLPPAIPSWVIPRFPFQFLTHGIVLPTPWAMEAILYVIHDASVWGSMAMVDSAQQFQCIWQWKIKNFTNIEKFLVEVKISRSHSSVLGQWMPWYELNVKTMCLTQFDLLLCYRCWQNPRVWLCGLKVRSRSEPGSFMSREKVVVKMVGVKKANRFPLASPGWNIFSARISWD